MGVNEIISFGEHKASFNEFSAKKICIRSIKLGYDLKKKQKQIQS